MRPETLQRILHTIYSRTSLIRTPKGQSEVSVLEGCPYKEEAAWPSGQRVGLAIRRSRVRVPLWPLAGFALGRP